MKRLTRLERIVLIFALTVVLVAVGFTAALIALTTLNRAEKADAAHLPMVPTFSIPTQLVIIQPPTASPTMTLTATTTQTPTATPTPTITHTPAPPDYQPMLTALQTYLADQQRIMPNLQIGLAFVDVQTGQAVHINGDVPHYSLSTFKGPLGAFYLWLVEQGTLTEQPRDIDHLIPMLNISDNIATSCIFKRVGGINPFNDWLADQGMTRSTNFVFRWAGWACKDDNQTYIPGTDWRYGTGDTALGLPGDYVLLRCIPGLACDKVFVPLELAYFYRRLYQSEVLTPENTRRWLDWMDKTPEGSALFTDLPSDAGIRVYAKNGFRATDAYYDGNFYNEAGIIETPQGAFVMTVFMRGHPRFPGGEVISELTRIAYEHFTLAYGAP